MKIYECKYGNCYPVDKEKECDKDCCEKCKPDEKCKKCHCKTKPCIVCWGKDRCKCIDDCRSCVSPVYCTIEKQDKDYDE